MIIERISPITGIVTKKNMPITQEQYDSWVSGTLAQNAFPNLSAGEREFIISGLTESDWDELFEVSYEYADDDDEIPF
jgi:hypothetical protein